MCMIVMIYLGIILCAQEGGNEHNRMKKKEYINAYMGVYACMLGQNKNMEINV